MGIFEEYLVDFYCKSNIEKYYVCCFVLELCAAKITTMSVISRDLVKWCIGANEQWVDDHDHDSNDDVQTSDCNISANTAK